MKIFYQDAAAIFLKSFCNQVLSNARLNASGENCKGRTDLKPETVLSELFISSCKVCNGG